MDGEKQKKKRLKFAACSCSLLDIENFCRNSKSRASDIDCRHHFPSIVSVVSLPRQLSECVMAAKIETNRSNGLLLLVNFGFIFIEVVNVFVNSYGTTRQLGESSRCFDISSVWRTFLSWFPWLSRRSVEQRAVHPGRFTIHFLLLPIIIEKVLSAIYLYLLFFFFLRA